jgi:hypothetical protein
MGCNHPPSRYQVSRRRYHVDFIVQHSFFSNISHRIARLPNPIPTRGCMVARSNASPNKSERAPTGGLALARMLVALGPGVLLTVGRGSSVAVHDQIR